MSDDAARFGDPRLPAETITSQSHLFHLGAQPPTTHDGGSFQQANEDNFPILKGQEASILLLTLQPGGIREPHWHPSAWELNIVTSGVATWVVIDGNGNHESFDQACRRRRVRAPGFLPLLREPRPGRHEDSDHPEHQCA